MIACALPVEGLTHAADAWRAERGDRGAVVPFDEQVRHVSETRPRVEVFNASDPLHSGSPGLGILQGEERVRDVLAKLLVLDAWGHEALRLPPLQVDSDRSGNVVAGNRKCPHATRGVGVGPT